MATRKRARRTPAKRSGSIPARVSRPRLRTRMRAWLTARVVHRALRNPLVRRAVERLQRRDEQEFAAMHPTTSDAPAAPETKPTAAQQQPHVIVVQVPVAADQQTAQVLHPAQQQRPQRRQPYPPLRAVSAPGPQHGPRVIPQTQPIPSVGAAPVAPVGSAPSGPEQLARMITGMLAQKGGNAVEVSSLATMFAQRGVGAQAVRAALWHGHSAGWVKRAGRGKVAATAKAVRAGGVPPDRKPGKRARRAG